MEQAQADYQAQQQKQRFFGEVKYGGRDVGQSAADAGQGRAPDKGGNPRFVVTKLGWRGSMALRPTVLHTRGDGEPDQGTAVGVVCGSDQLSRLVGQSIPAAAVQLRVCAVGTIAGAGVGEHGTGAGTSEHHPAEALENRRGGLGATPGGFGCF